MMLAAVNNIVGIISLFTGVKRLSDLSKATTLGGGKDHPRSNFPLCQHTSKASRSLGTAQAPRPLEMPPGTICPFPEGGGLKTRPLQETLAGHTQTPLVSRVQP